tara:strand:- start:163 stop:960 length:798 start_codon:yes stop_codon:yes gene_type:complete
MTNIISIQSTVLNDLVGNQAARYILSPKKYNFFEIPTIALTSHKAHKNSIQLHSKNLNPWRIFNSMKKTYKFNSKDFTIIGYTPDYSIARSIKKIIEKQNNVLLDPVMGDIGIGLYVNKDVANFFKKMILKVSYVSANFFEWSYLNGKNINSYPLKEILFDLKKFSLNHNTQLFIRSIPFEGKLLNILCKKKQVWGVSTPYINFKDRFHGAGDLSTALYADNILRKNNLKKTLENVTKEIFIHLIKFKNKRGKRILFKAKNLSNL